MKHTVHVKSDGFHPKKVLVKSGETVEWINDDKINHFVSFVDVPMMCPKPRADHKCEMKFTEKGEHPYHCRKQPQLQGEVVVV